MLPMIMVINSHTRVLDKDQQLLVRSVLCSANACVVEGDPEINLRPGVTYDNKIPTNTAGLGHILTGEPGDKHPLAGTQGSNTTSADVNPGGLQAELGLLTEMGGSSMDVDVTDFMSFIFITPNDRANPTKTTVIEVDEEMGKFLLNMLMMDRKNGAFRTLSKRGPSLMRGLWRRPMEIYQILTPKY